MPEKVENSRRSVYRKIQEPEEKYRSRPPRRNLHRAGDRRCILRVASRIEPTRGQTAREIEKAREALDSALKETGSYSSFPRARRRRRCRARQWGAASTRRSSRRQLSFRPLFDTPYPIYSRYPSYVCTRSAYDIPERCTFAWSSRCRCCRCRGHRDDARHDRVQSPGNATLCASPLHARKTSASFTKTFQRDTARALLVFLSGVPACLSLLSFLSPARLSRTAGCTLD